MEAEGTLLNGARGKQERIGILRRACYV